MTHQKIWQRLKRPRNEGKKFQVVKGHDNSAVAMNLIPRVAVKHGHMEKGKGDVVHGAVVAGKVKPQAIDYQADKGFGIKSMIDVEVVAPNRLTTGPGRSDGIVEWR